MFSYVLEVYSSLVRKRLSGKIRDNLETQVPFYPRPERSELVAMILLNFVEAGATKKLLSPDRFGRTGRSLLWAAVRKSNA